MKNPFSLRLSIILVSLFMGILLLSNCGISNNASVPNENSSDPNLIQPTEEESTIVTWSSLFRKVPGIDVRGTEPNLSLRIRGARSISLPNEPLFVLDGVPLGNNFGGLARSIYPKDVKSIRVLKGPAAAIYGHRGAYGVIVVKQKQ